MKIMNARFKLLFVLALAVALLTPFVVAGEPGTEALQTSDASIVVPEKPVDIPAQMKSMSASELPRLSPFITTLLPDSPLSLASGFDFDELGDRYDASELRRVMLATELSDDFIREVPISGDQLRMKPIDLGGLLRSGVPSLGDPSGINGGLSDLLTRPVDLTEIEPAPPSEIQDDTLLTNLTPVPVTDQQGGQNAAGFFSMVTSSVTAEVRPVEKGNPGTSANQADQSAILNYRMLQLEKEKSERTANVKSEDDSPEERFWKELRTFRRKPKAR